MHTQIPTEIRAYLEDLLIQAGITHQDPVEREAMIQELYVRLDKFLSLKMVDHIPEENLEAFATLVESNPSQEILQQFVAEHIPNPQEVFTVAFGEFRDMYINGITQSQKVTQEI